MVTVADAFAVVLSFSFVFVRGCCLDLVADCC